MEKDTHKTKVIFRKDPEWERIIAFFPEEVSDFQGFYCTCYSLQEGHSSAVYEYYRVNTKPVDLKECEDIIRNLESIGYNLQIIKRWNEPKAYQVRKAELKKIA